MSFAEHPAVHLPVFCQPLSTLGVPGVLTQEMLRVVAVACMGNSTGSFDRLTARTRCTERIVGFMIMVCAERLPVKDVKALIRERFLYILRRE